MSAQRVRAVLAAMAGHGGLERASQASGVALAHLRRIASGKAIASASDAALLLDGLAPVAEEVLAVRDPKLQRVVGHEPAHPDLRAALEALRAAA